MASMGPPPLMWVRNYHSALVPQQVLRTCMDDALAMEGLAWDVASAPAMVLLLTLCTLQWQ
eukprot:192492-Alexandrium_andersonii.AAC.1